MNRQRYIHRVVRGTIAAALCAAAVATAHAANIPGYPPDIEAYDAREVAMLPRYCMYTQMFRDRVPGGANQDEIARLRAELGEPFQALHHYCWGLMKTNRAMLLARTNQDKRFYLGASLSEFDYVIRHSTPEFVLLPEILTRKGENLLRLGRNAVGVRELEQAISLKPDYWPPYAVLSDHYRKAGQIGKARDVLDKGIAAVPDAKALQRRLSELGATGAKNVEQPTAVRAAREAPAQ